MKEKHSNKGFTLIEMIVSVGIFTMIATAAISALLVISSASKRAQATRSLVSATNVAIEEISRAGQRGIRYVCAEPFEEQTTCDSSTVQSIDIVDKTGATTTYSRVVVSGVGVIQRQFNYRAAQTISPGSVDITSLTFKVTDPDSDTLQPRMEIMVSARIGTTSKYSNTLNIFTSTAMRER